MANNRWRKELDILINQNMSELIIETKEYDYAITKAGDKGKAQMWVALAIINHKLNTILTQKEYKKKIPQEEMDKIIETLEKL